MEKQSSPPSNPSTAITLSSPSPSPVSIRTPHSPTSVKADDAEKKQQFIANFSALYRSILPPDSPPMKSVSAPRRPLLLHGSSGSSIDVQKSTSGDSSNAFSDADLELEEAEARFALEYEQLCDRYLCRAQIQDLTNEINALRRENVCLKTELVKQLNLSSKRSLHDNFRRLNLIDSGTDFSGDELSTYSPTSVVEQSRFERDEPERVWLPKSISVRSTNYFKPAANNNASTRMASQLRASKEPEAAKVQHRMHLPGAKKELEVYSQGMFKTELCNKWQETGACPYGDHCQFAHGIGELRPVIRHPRYKTEVCRMVMAGDACPYGHRCHFRHSLTEQELMLARAASH